MMMRESLLEQGVNNANLVGQQITKTAIGYVFDLGNLAFINPNPNDQSGFGNLLLGNAPFMLPIQYNWSGNLFINVLYQTVDGGGHWTADPRFVIAPCTVDDTILNTGGSSWQLGETFPTTNYAVMAETFGNKIIGTTGTGGSATLQFSSQQLINNPSSNVLNQGAFYGTFQFGFYYDNYTNPNAGDQFLINKMMLFLPYSSGVRI